MEKVRSEDAREKKTVRTCGFQVFYQISFLLCVGVRNHFRCALNEKSRAYQKSVVRRLI